MTQAEQTTIFDSEDVVSDEDSMTTYHPILGGWRAERDGQTEFIYLNPSGGSDDGIPTVFLYQGTVGDPAQDGAIVHVVVFDSEPEESTCRHCDRRIVLHGDRWVDPEATGDDSIWRETCDEHDTFIADHEPTDQAPSSGPLGKDEK